MGLMQINNKSCDMVSSMYDCSGGHFESILMRGILHDVEHGSPRIGSADQSFDELALRHAGTLVPHFSRPQFGGLCNFQLGGI